MYFNKFCQKNNLQLLITGKNFFISISLLTFLVLATSLIIQYVLLIQPCILCSLQRLLFGLILIFTLLGLIVELLLFHKLPLIWSRIISRVIILSVIFLAFLGLAIAIKQTLFQLFPEQGLTSCGLGLQQLFREYSIIKIITMIIQGKLACHEIGLRLWGLSLANWGAMIFLVVLIMGIIVICFNKHSYFT